MTELRCHPANAGDTDALVPLWQQVFGDDEAFIRYALEVFARKVYVAAPEDGPPVAQLLAVPCGLEECQGVYFYALATHPDYRGAGVMSRLMRLAEDQAAAEGIGFAALIPADVPLYAYYRKRGYTVDVPLRHFAIEGGGETGEWERHILTAGSLDEARRAWLEVPIVTFPPAQMGMICEDIGEAAALAVSSDGYAVYLPGPGGELLVPELAAANDEAARTLLAGLLAETGSPRARISLPAQSPQLPGGTVHPVALVKPLSAAWPEGAVPYLRFGIDDVPDSFTMWDG